MDLCPLGGPVCLSVRLSALCDYSEAAFVRLESAGGAVKNR